MQDDTTFYPQMLQDLYEKGYFNCQIYTHPGQNCTQYSLGFFPKVFKISFKYYLPIHLLPGLFFQRKILMKDPLLFFTKIIKASIRSTLFMTMLQVSLQFFICSVNKFRKFDGFNGFLGSFLAGISILIENPSRREELALFSTPNLLEIIFAYLKKRNILNFMHQNYQLIYSIAIAILVIQYNKKNNSIKSSYNKMFELMWGDL